GSEASLADVEKKWYPLRWPHHVFNWAIQQRTGGQAGSIFQQIEPFRALISTQASRTTSWPEIEKQIAICHQRQLDEAINSKSKQQLSPRASPGASRPGHDNGEEGDVESEELMISAIDH